MMTVFFSFTYFDETAPDLLQASTLLHTNDTDVVLLVDPDDEVLRLVHEDATANLKTEEHNFNLNSK